MEQIRLKSISKFPGDLASQFMASLDEVWFVPNYY